MSGVELLTAQMRDDLTADYCLRVLTGERHTVAMHLMPAAELLIRGLEALEQAHPVAGKGEAGDAYKEALALKWPSDEQLAEMREDRPDEVEQTLEHWRRQARYAQLSEDAQDCECALYKLVRGLGETDADRAALLIAVFAPEWRPTLSEDSTVVQISPRVSLCFQDGGHCTLRAEFYDIEEMTVARIGLHAWGDGEGWEHFGSEDWRKGHRALTAALDRVKGVTA